MSADRHITPRVIAYLRDTLPAIDVPVPRRASFENCQLVLRQLARWARRVDPDDPGRWHSTDSIGQVVAGTCLTVATVRAGLRCLEATGLVVVVKRGGGRGALARGTTRLLVLDPVDNPGTERAKHAQFRPELRVLTAFTARANGETARAIARDTVLTSVYTSARDAETERVLTAVAADAANFYIPAYVLDRWGDRLGLNVRPIEDVDTGGLL